MVRVQTADEKEYLSSFQEWFAIDKLGNELNDTLRGPDETWITIHSLATICPRIRIIQMVQKNPRLQELNLLPMNLQCHLPQKTLTGFMKCAVQRPLVL